MSGRVTLRDIASRCGVSVAMVSTVLNGREGRMRCSEEKRCLIQRTAETLHYHANILARSIRKQHIPIVGVFLHCSTGEGMLLNHYIQVMLGGITSSLNRHHLEALFVPYGDEDEQLHRMQELFGQGFLGGIITNIIPGRDDGVCEFLSSSGIPHMVLGYPSSRRIYGICHCSIELTKCIMQLRLKHGCREAFAVSLEEGSPLPAFRRYPFPEDYFWKAPVVPLEEVRTAAPDSLLVLHGIALRGKLEPMGISGKHQVVVEREELLQTEKKDMDLISVRFKHHDIAYMEQALCPWILEGRLPVRKLVKISDNQEFQFYEAEIRKGEQL